MRHKQNQSSLTVQLRTPNIKHTAFALKAKAGSAHIHSLSEWEAADTNTISTVPFIEPLAKPSNTLSYETQAIFPLTDLGNAERFAHHYGESVRYDHTNRRWLIWQGKFWREDDTRKIEHFAKNTVRRIRDDALEENDPQEYKKIKKHAQASEARRGIRNMIEQAKSEGAIAITANDLDTHKYLLNVQNGTIDLRDGKLHPHEPKHLITRYLDIRFDETTECPLWLQFMERIMEGNQALIAFLQRALGYSLTGDTSEQCLFFLYGDGSNGKSTFIETALVGLLGPYTYKLPIESLLAKKYAGIPNDIARLKGARAAIASEVPEGRRLNESLIKDLTGGDTITARFLRKEFFEFRPESKLWLYGNYKPTITGSDEGIWRRINIIPFSVQISDADKNLGKKLNAEWPGILAWAVKGALEWQQQGLNPPPAVLTATSTYRREMDSIGTFLDKCCVINKEYKVSAKALYEAYKDWGRDGENLLSQRRLGERLSKKGLERKRGTGGYYWWRGIGLRDEYKVAN